MLASPQIALRRPQELEEKYEYIYFHMNIDTDDFPESYAWFELELDDIIMRHEFLKKTGRYITPDPKRPQYKKVGLFP